MFVYLTNVEFWSFRSTVCHQWCRIATLVARWANSIYPSLQYCPNFWAYLAGCRGRTCGGMYYLVYALATLEVWYLKILHSRRLFRHHYSPQSEAIASFKIRSDAFTKAWYTGRTRHMTTIHLALQSADYLTGLASRLTLWSFIALFQALFVQ